MSQQIPVAFAQKYRDDIIMLAQQRQSKLLDTVRRDPEAINGKAAFFERMAPTEGQEKTTRHQNTPQIDTVHSRRRVTVRTFNWADLIDRNDQAKMLAGASLPQRYVDNGVAFIRRRQDLAIVRALGGNAYSMDADDAATTVPLPSAQKILHGSTGLTLTKLLQAKEILDGADNDEEEDRFLVYRAKQFTNLLNTTEVKSADYNTVKALVEGKIDTFLGFKFRRSERLETDGTNRLCYAYLRSAIGFAWGAGGGTPMGGAEGSDIYTSLSVRNDKSDAWQAYVEATFDATRIEDEKVVQIACVES